MAHGPNSARVYYCAEKENTTNDMIAFQDLGDIELTIDLWNMAQSNSIRSQGAPRLTSPHATILGVPLPFKHSMLATVPVTPDTIILQSRLTISHFSSRVQRTRKSLHWCHPSWNGPKTQHLNHSDTRRRRSVEAS